MEMIRLAADEINEKYAGCKTLAGLIAQLEKQTEAEGRVICSVKVDGLQMSEADEERFGSTLLTDVKNIEIGTAESASLLKASVHAVREWIERLKVGAVELADLFRSGRSQQAQRNFAEMMEAQKQLLDTLIVLKANLLHQNADGQIDENWKNCETHLVHTARELLAAYEAGDDILVADVLEYELHNSMENWLQLITVPD